MAKQPSKLLGEWFWTDRWMGSSAFLLPLEARGLYREMLTQAWRRGGKLPADFEAIRRAVGCTSAEWRRAWPQIEKYWRLDGDCYVNDTQLEVIGDAVSAHNRAVERGKKGAAIRAKLREQAVEQLPVNLPAELPAELPEQAPYKCEPPSPSPSVSLLKNAERPARASDDPRKPHPLDEAPAPIPAPMVEWFDRIWARYPNQEGKARANREWITLRPDAALAAHILARIDDRLRLGWGAEPRFVPHLGRFLAERMWKERFTPRTTAKPAAPVSTVPGVDETQRMLAEHRAARAAR